MFNKAAGDTLKLTQNKMGLLCLILYTCVMVLQ